jgi:hypothetical protein
MTVEGYPSGTIFLALLIGGCLLIKRPYYVVLFSVLAFTGGNSFRFTATRLPGVGPYWNLNDTFVFMALVAAAIDLYRRRQAPCIPPVVLALLSILVVGAAQSYWVMGFSYEVTRALRWGLQLPVAFVIGANVVASTHRARDLLFVAAIGCLLGAGQHLAEIIFNKFKYIDLDSYHQVRTIAYLGGSVACAFIISVPMLKVPLLSARGFGVNGVVSILAVSIIWTQTRSLWISAIVAFPLVYWWLNRTLTLKLMVRYLAVSMSVGSFIIGVNFLITPNIRAEAIILERLLNLADSNPSTSTTLSRQRQARVELDGWLEGTLIFGKGLYFYGAYHNPKGRRRIAFGHLGHLTYLTQLGLLGSFIYSIFLPYAVLRASRRLWLEKSMTVRTLGLVACASIIQLSVMFLMSSSFLSVAFFAPGIIYGGAWALAVGKRRDLAPVVSRTLLLDSSTEEG